MTKGAEQVRHIRRRDFLRCVAGGAAGLAAGPLARAAAAGGAARPNILFAIADDWSWPHASIAGDPVVKTPTFDRIAREGVLFMQAHVASPSCTPSRGSVLTGQMFYRLEEGANLFGTLPKKFRVYPDVLEQAGYHVGYTRKGWSPGRPEPGGWKRNPAGRQYRSFADFLKSVPAGKPFCFWFGSTDPHRSYKPGSGAAAGMDPAKVRVPPFMPDSPEVRSDICDYFFEVQRFDREVGQIYNLLGQAGRLDETLLVMTSDNGMPFPRAKSNVYDFGTHMPLAVRWAGKVRSGRVVDDFVSFCDFAPTFLEAAGLAPLPEMTGRSLVGLLTSEKSGRIDPKRDHVVTGKERHCPCRKFPGGFAGYPMRAIRTHAFAYIRNFKPDRWPAGPEKVEVGRGYEFWDIDRSPSKQYMMDHRGEPGVRRLFELAFGKRPPEELFDLTKDPGELNNVAGRPEYAKVRGELADRLTAYLKRTGDPRVLGRGDEFERYPSYAGMPRKKPARKPPKRK